MDQVAPVDGRLARGEKTRRRLAETLIALLEEGDDPTARNIAARAGVSLRLVFHHFDDMEQLMRTAVAVQVERHWSKLQPVDPSLTLEERIDALVAQRVSLYEHIAPVRRAAERAAHNSPTLAAELGRARQRLRHSLEQAFETELDRARADRDGTLDALEVAAGWEAWDQLRSRSELDVTRAELVVRRLVRGALAGADPRGDR